MKKRFLLLIISLIFLVSFLTFILILKYLDPYSSKYMSIIFLSLSFLLTISSFLSLILYFVKKIYYRGNIGLYDVKTSFRQAFFIWLFIFWVIVFRIFWVWIFFTWILLFILFTFLELFIQNLEN